MAATLPYPNLYEGNELAPSPPVDAGTTPILDPYTRGYMAQGIQQGQLWDIATPEGYEAEAQRRTGLLREAVVPAAEQTLARGLEDVRTTMQKGGKLSSSAAVKQQMRTSELYGAQVAGTMAQGTLGIYEQLGTERSNELNRMLQSGITETGAIQQMYQTRAGLASQERITQIQENTRAQIAQIQASTELSAQEKQLQIAQLQASAQKETATITGEYGLTGTKYSADTQRQIADVQTQMQRQIAQIEADTTLTVEDKRAAVAKLQFASQEKIANIQATAQVNVAEIGLEGTKYGADTQLAISKVQVAGDQVVANIQASTTLSVADKQTAMEAARDQTTIAVAKIVQATDNYGVDVGLQVAGLQTDMQKTVAEIQADTTLTVAQKEQKTALSQIAASERIADVQAQAQITSTTIAGTLAGEASRDVAGIGAEADRYKADADKDIATVQSNTALSISDKEQKTAQIKITAEFDIGMANIKSAETMNAADNATATVIENIRTQKDTLIANIQANTALSVKDKDVAIANINAQTELSITAANNASREKSVLAEIAGSKDIAEINTKSNELMATNRNNLDTAMAKLDADTKLTLADKEMLKTREITRSNEAIADIEATSVIAQIQGTKDVADIQANSAKVVQRLQSTAAKDIARINSYTTLSVADKEKEIAKINNQTQLAIENTKSRTALGIADKGIIEAKTVADIHTKSAEKMNLINDQKDRDLAKLDADTSLTLAEKEKERTKIITQSNEDIAATNNLSAEAIANAQITGQKEIAELTTETQKYISDNSITGATTIANIQTLSNEKINAVNEKKDRDIAAINADTSLSLSEKETERTKLNNQADKDIAVINTASAEIIANKQAETAKYLGNLSSETQKYISDTGLAEQVREFDIETLAQKAKDMNTYQRRNPVTKAIETVSEPWAVTIARETMAQELNKFNKTEMGKDENGNDVPRWQLELKARTKETMVDYVDENGDTKSVPVAYAIAQDQFDNIITTMDMSNDAEWDRLGRQIDAAVQSDILDAQTTRTIAANALAQRAKESDDVVDQQQYQNMVDLITNPAVIAYMEKNPAKDIMGDAIIALLGSSFTGEEFTVTPEQFINMLSDYDKGGIRGNPAYNEYTRTVLARENKESGANNQDITQSPTLIKDTFDSYKKDPNKSQAEFITWIRANPEKAEILVKNYKEQMGKELPDYIKEYKKYLNK